MHPTLVRSHVLDAVGELRERLDVRDDLGVVDVEVDLERLVLDVTCDHAEHETELVNATSPILSPAGVPIVRAMRIPMLGRARRRRLILRFGLDDYDFLAPTAELLDADANPIPFAQWPTSIGGGGIVDNHPTYKRPFFCRRGLREFHELDQHEDVPWAAWRDGLPLHATVTELLEDLAKRWHAAA
jgi:hypothetical protein